MKVSTILASFLSAAIVSAMPTGTDPDSAQMYAIGHSFSYSVMSDDTQLV